MPPVLTVSCIDDLTTDGLSVSARTGDGCCSWRALVAGLALIACVLARTWSRAGERVGLGPAGARAGAARGVVAAVAVALVGVGALALSDRGIGGTVSAPGRRVHRGQVRPPERPRPRAAHNSGNRWVWWEEAVGGFADRPVTGYGAGSFPLVHLRYRENRLEVRHAHSVPLEFLAETGLVGALLALGGLALLVLAAVGATGARGPGPRARLRRAPCWRRCRVVAAPLGGLGLGHPRGDAARAGVPRRAGGRARRAGRPRPPRRHAAARPGGAGRRRAALAAWWRWPRCRRCREDLSDEALSQAASGSAGDLREAAEKAALAKRLNPFAVGAAVRAGVDRRARQPARRGGGCWWRRSTASPTTPTPGAGWPASRSWWTTPRRALRR